ncbi:unnamed protein product, partial [Symbiodinium pilosum]
DFSQQAYQSASSACEQAPSTEEVQAGVEDMIDRAQQQLTGVQEGAAAAAQAVHVAQPLAQAQPAVNLGDAARASRRRVSSTAAPMLSCDHLSDEMRQVVSAMPLRLQTIILQEVAARGRLSDDQVVNIIQSVIYRELDEA